MIAKFLFVAVCFCAASAQDSDDLVKNLNILRNLTEVADVRVDQTLVVLDSARAVNDEMTKERLECICWENEVQRNTLNKTITEAVSKGMEKNKQFISFQCISNAGRETFEKLNVTYSAIPATVQKLNDKGVAGILPFRLVIPGFKNYIKVLHQTKHDELIKTQKEPERKKILEEVEKKVKLLLNVMEEINKKVTEAKFQFFSDFVNFIYATENNLKRIQKEGSQKVLKCVA